jgi:hypothetical protein
VIKSIARFEFLNQTGWIGGGWICRPLSCRESATSNCYTTPHGRTFSDTPRRSIRAKCCLGPTTVTNAKRQTSGLMNWVIRCLCMANCQFSRSEIALGVLVAGENPAKGPPAMRDLLALPAQPSKGSVLDFCLPTRTRTVPNCVLKAYSQSTARLFLAYLAPEMLFTPEIERKNARFQPLCEAQHRGRYVDLSVMCIKRSHLRRVLAFSGMPVW